MVGDSTMLMSLNVKERWLDLLVGDDFVDGIVRSMPLSDVPEQPGLIESLTADGIDYGPIISKHSHV